MAAELKAIASLDGKNFESGINRIDGKTDSFAKKLGSMKGLIVGAFGVGAIIRFSRSMLRMADDLNTAANTAGITMESMLGLQAAMAESGIKAEGMLRILSRLPRAQSEVIDGNKNMVEALNALNISQDEFVSLDADRLLERIGQAYGESEKGAEAFNAITAIFGERIGPQMIEVLERLNKDGLDKFTEGAKDAADGMRTLAEASDALEKVGNRLTLWAGKFVGFLERIRDAATVAAMALMHVVRTSNAMGVDAFRERIDAVRRGAQAGWRRGDETGMGGAEGGAGATGGAAIPPAVKANLDALQRRREADAEKLAEKQMQIDKRVADQRQRQAEAIEDFQKRRADIMTGKGVQTPDTARVGGLQRIGGIVGGVAGAGDQAARIAQQQLNAQKAVEDLTQQSLRRLEQIENRIRELGGE